MVNGTGGGAVDGAAVASWGVVEADGGTDDSDGISGKGNRGTVAVAAVELSELFSAVFGNCGAFVFGRGGL